MKHTVRRIISIFLVITMMLSVLPVGVFAAGPDGTEDQETVYTADGDTGTITEPGEPVPEPTKETSEPASEPTSEPAEETKPQATDPEETESKETEPEETDPEETEPEETEEETVEDVRMLSLRIATPDGPMFLEASSDSLQYQIVQAEDGDTVTMDRNYTENIYFPLNKTVTLDLGGYILTPDTSDAGSSIVNTITVYGEAEIVNGIIDGWLNGAERNVRGALVTNGGKLTLSEGAQIRSFAVKGSGGGIHVDGDGELVLNGGKVCNNEATESGGGIFIYEGGNLTAGNGARISENKATSGGGIAMYRMFHNRINGMTLAENKAESGGGMYIGGLVDLLPEEPLANITFKENEATQGGGLCCGDKVTADLKNLVFDGNTTTARGGAAYFMGAFNGTFRNCQVRNNQHGTGALYFLAASSANFTGTTLSGNQATGNGGALYAAAAMNMELREVTISDNTAGLEGTGHTYGGAFMLNSYPNNVTLYSGTISGNTAKARSSANSYGYGGAFYINSYTGSNKSTFTMYGGTFDGNVASYSGGGVYLNSYSTAVIEGGEFRNNRGNGGYGGALYTNTNTTLEIRDVLAEKNAGTAFYGNGNVTVTGGIFRENTTGAYTISAVTAQNGTLTVTGGTFTGNTGVTVGNYGGTVTVSGGEICGNTSHGVGNRYGKVNILEGASIHDNGGYGVYNSNERSSVEMTGGVIENNATGGIYDYSNNVMSTGTKGTVSVSGGQIRNNGGPGIYATVVNVSGGEISGNTRGVQALEATITGGTITGNAGVTTGGGVYISRGTRYGTAPNYTYYRSYLKITGGIIRDNRATTRGNDIYIAPEAYGDPGETDISIQAASGMTGGAEGDAWYDEISGENLTESFTRRHRGEKDEDAYTFRSASDEVARIGDRVYPSLQAAFDDMAAGTAPEGEDTVYLLKDDNENVVIPAGITATLDLQGYLVFTNSGTILTLGKAPEEGEPAQSAPVNLTVTDSVGGGKLTGATTGAVVVNSGSSFTMENISIEKNLNTASAGGGVILRSGSAMTMESGTISGNQGKGGSGIYGEENTQLTILDGAITGNRTNGGHGAVYSKGTVTMKGGQITKNEISSYNVFTALFITGENARFELKGGTISENLRGYSNGGSIALVNGAGPIGIWQGAEMVMNGGSITDNQNITSGNTNCATAVNVYNNVSSGKASSFTMNGGIISGNTGAAGAVCVSGSATFTMEGGSITGNRNTANEGGAVRVVGGKGEVNLRGGEITGNASKGFGGGVYIGAYNTNQVSIDGTKVWANTSGAGQGNDVYLGNLVQVLAFQNASAYGLDYNCWHEDATGNDYNQTDFDAFCQAQGWNRTGATYQSNGRGFTAANAILPPAEVSGAVAYYIPVLRDDSGNPQEVTEGNYVYFQSLKEAMDALKAESYTREDGENVEIPSGATIWLMQNFGETVEVPAVTFTLNLNGHTLTTDKMNATIFTLASGANMTLDDTAGPISHEEGGIGTLTTSYATGRGFEVKAGASLTIQGGRITGFAMANKTGPAISCQGNLTITGGSVTQNIYSGTANSGAIHVSNANSVVTVTGVSFADNEGNAGGAVAIEKAREVTIEKVTFESNTATTNGGAVYIGSESKVTLNDVTFRNNQVLAGSGGGLMTADSYNIALNLDSCVFEGNKASNRGGGMYLGTGAIANIQKGTFLDNQASYGGGLYSYVRNLNNGDLTMTEVTFRGNHAELEGGGAYVRRLTMEDCKFEENTSVGTGGGLRHYGDQVSDSLSVKGSTFTGNSAGNADQKNSGGAISSANGSMTLTENSFEGNRATDSGGAVCRSGNSTGGTSLVDACTFHANTAGNLGGGLYTVGAATLKNSEFYENQASSGGAISTCRGTTTEITGCKVHHNTATNGGGIFQNNNNNSSTLYTILSGKTEVYGNQANQGGGVYGYYIHMKGDAKVYENTAKWYGGGVYANTRFEMDDNAEIRGNQAVQNHGGGVYGPSTINGGSIRGNTAYHGGGIYTTGAVTVNGGEVSGNTATYDGGGVYARTFTMNGGDIRGNTAGRYGGGVGNSEGSGNLGGSYLFNFKMYGGTIRDNEAGDSGGGVYAACNNPGWNPVPVAHHWLAGGEISGNRAGRNGGGAVLGQNTDSGETRIYGGTVITGNHAGNYGGGIYYYWGSLQEQNFGLYTGDEEHSTPTATMYGNTAGLGQDYYIAKNANPNICRATDMNLPENLHVEGWLDESNNNLITTEIHGRNNRYWALTLAYSDEQIVAAVGDKLFSSVGKAVDYVKQNPNGSHEIVMVADSRENVTVPASVEVTLNLNGHTLQGFSTAVTLNGSLTLIDEENHDYDDNDQAMNKIGAGTPGAGTVSGNTATYGGGFVVQNGGELTIQSGNLSGCYAANGGAAVYVNGGTATMNGGKIFDNYSSGGAVYVNQSRSTFIMNGGEICYNVNRSQASNYTLGEGTLRNTGGTMMIQGGEIHDNEARSVVDSNGATTISGGSFVHNRIGSATNNQTGTGLIRVTGGTTNIGGTGANPVIIRDNASTGGAGAISQSGGSVYLSYMEIKGNTAATYGGAIWQSGGTMVITTGTEISDNIALSRGGAIYQSGGTMQILSGSIVNNRAPVGGGIAQKGDSSANCSVFDGVKLYENVSTVSNTGNDVYSACEGTAKPNSSMTLESAVNMGHSSYNVWRDDVYSGDNYEETESIDKGMYITGPIDRSNNLQLTAYHYETDQPLTPLANNRKVTSLSFARTDGQLPCISGSYVSPAGDITTPERTAQDMLDAGEAGWVESAETYVDADRKPQHFIAGPGGQLYERNQLVQWTAGEDGSQESNLVLSNDTITYNLSAVFEAEEEGKTAKARVWLEVELDADPSEANINMPADFRGYVLTEMRNGKQVQILRCYKEGDLRQGDNITYPLSINVRGMQNGATLKPQFRMWVDGNEKNEQNPATASSDRITVSATGKYNVTLKQNSKLAYTGYFDGASGQEASRPVEGEESGDVVYGTMLGYGITVMMCNTGEDGKTVPAGKGLKGLEIPADGLELDLHLKGGLYLDGQELSVNGDGSNTVTPIFWAIKENEKGDTGRGYGQSSSTFNMKWDDEDENTICTNYAYDAAPFNTGNNSTSCYSGGGWAVTGSSGEGGELVLHMKVNGYAFDMSSSYPNKNSDGSDSEQFNNNYTKPFSAGYVQIIFPFPERVVQEANGFLSVDMQAAVSDVQIRSASGQDPLKGTETEILDAYFGSPEAAKEHATGEVRFSDNRVASSNGLYIYHGDGNADQISLVNYWLTDTRGAIAGEYGNGTTPLGSQVYMGGQLFYTSGTYRTDEEYLDEEHKNPNPYYIPEDQFNPQTDNKTEYNYATAINVLQKFDADAYTPLPSKRMVNERISGIYDQNNIYVGTTETATNWTDPKLTTSMNLTVLYGAKPDGKNWNKVTTTAREMLAREEAEPADDGMIRYKGQLYRPDQPVYSDGGVGEMDQYHEGQLLYFETLEELQAYFGGEGKCVAILYEARDCCIRTGRNIRFEHKMQVTNDFSYTGRTYCTTNDGRVWSTYRPDYKQVRDNADQRKAYLYDFDWDNVTIDGTAKGFAKDPGGYEKNVEYSTDDYEPKTVTITRRALKTETDAEGNQTFEWITVNQDRALKEVVHQASSGYIKTEYEYGYQKAGTHNGWRKGNTLLLYTLTSSITIEGTDKVSESSNATKTEYDLSKGERIAGFKVTPTLSKSSAVNNALVSNGSQSVQVGIDLVLPAGIQYREGSIAFDYTPDKINDKEQPTYREGELEWVIGAAETDENGVTTIHLTTYVTDTEKNLPKITFSGFIGSEDNYDVQNGDSFSVSASIWTAYEEQNQLAATAKEDAFTLHVIKREKVGIYKDALTLPNTENLDATHSLLVEIGEDFGYKLVYRNDSDLVNNVTIADVLPYNGDGRGTNFNGGYRVKQIQVVFTGKGAKDTADAFRTGVYIAPDAVNPSLAADPQNPNAVEDAWKALVEAKPGNSYEDPKIEEDEETTRYTFTYDIPEEQAIQLATDTEGKLLYVALPQVAGQTNVAINVILSAMDKAGEDAQLITADGKTQQGEDAYTNDFAVSSGDPKNNPNWKPLKSLDVDVTVVQRAITGFAFMDMNQDGRFTQGNNADKPLKDVTVTLCTPDGTPVESDVLGKPLEPVKTGEDGSYTFTNIAPGDYIVRFTDPDGKYVWRDNQPSFDQLAVTQLPGADSGYYQTAANVNRCVAEYKDDGTGLEAAKLNITVSMPGKGEMKTATVISTHNNAGFYCVEAKLMKDWTGMVRQVPAGTNLTYHLKGTVENGRVTVYEKDITLTQGTPWSRVTATDLPSDLSNLTVTATMSKEAPVTYHWETNTFYLPAKDGSGRDIGYTFTESLTDPKDFGDYDEPRLEVKLDAISGQTSFQAENHQRSYDFAFTKVDAKTGEGLSGAKFQFTKDGTTLKFTKVADGSYRVSCDNVDVDVKNGETNGETQVEVGKNGTLTLSGLPEGIITMRETKAPKGHVLPRGSWTIRFFTEFVEDGSEDPQGTPRIEILASEEATDQPAIGVDEETGTYLVPNVPHYTVPITGAEGIGMYLITGLAIAVAGALLLLEYRRRKRQTGAGGM